MASPSFISRIDEPISFLLGRLSRSNSSASVFLAAAVLVAVFVSRTASAAAPMGGFHLGYSIGAAAADRNSGLRHGLDLAAMYGFVTERASGIQSFSGVEGFVFGPSAIIGFGDTPNYLAMDAGYGFSTIAGGLASVGPVYRFGFDKMPKGVGGEVRLAFDFVLVDTGVRIMALRGPASSSEVLATLFLGFGRF